jgi:hypothetical protein
VIHIDVFHKGEESHYEISEGKKLSFLEKILVVNLELIIYADSVMIQNEEGQKVLFKKGDGLSRNIMDEDSYEYKNTGVRKHVYAYIFDEAYFD